MLKFILRLFQLLLAPQAGWEDVSSAALPEDKIRKSGFTPWVIVVALSELLRLYYQPDLSVFSAIMSALIVGGSLFVSMYIARLILEIGIERIIRATVSPARIHIFTLYNLGVIGIYRVLTNAIPASLTILFFLPLLSIIVIHKGMSYVGVKEQSAFPFLVLGVIAILVIPYLLIRILSLLI